MIRKENRVFNFSVEGYTEKWYLEWLAKEINNSRSNKYNAVIKATVNKSPSKYSKYQTYLKGSAYYHICDVEGQTDYDISTFQNVLSELKSAKQKLIGYKLGYSNLSFELWMILHKNACNGCQTTKDAYLTQLNRLFGKSFLSLDEYKDEDNFKSCLSQLKLADVRSAIGRASSIMQQRTSSSVPVKYCNEIYFKENPSLTINKVVEEILKTCL